MIAENTTEYVANNATMPLLNFYAIGTILVLVSVAVGIVIGIMIEKEKKELEREFWKNDPGTEEEMRAKKEYRSVK